MIQLKLSDSDICERRKAQLKEWCGSETDHASSKMREPDKIKFPLSVQLLAACSNSDLDEFSRLLKLGTDINTQNADGLTSTHLACINVDFDFLKFLISNGADINLQDHEGWTPLHAAASVGCCELARFLIENGADLSVLSVDLELPIDVAQDEEMINLLTDAMKKQNVDADAIKHSEEQTLLHDAQHWLTSGQYKPVIDSRTGATPLHVAACKDYTKAMEILLQIPGLDINAKDFDGWTALHAAAHWNREASARILANAGASFDEHTRASQSVFDVADKEMIVLLRQLRERQRAERLSTSSKLSFESSKPTEAVKRSHPVELETDEGNVSSDDDNSIIELDPSNCVNKKPTIEQDLYSPPTVSSSEQLIKTVCSTEDTPLNTTSSSILPQEQTVILQSSASTTMSISRLSDESSDHQLMTPPLSSTQLEKTVPTKDTDDSLLNSTINKPLIPITKSVFASSKESSALFTSTMSVLSSVNDSSSINGNNNKLIEQEISDNSLTKAFNYDMKATSVSTLTQPTSALRQSSHSTLPVSLSDDISLSALSPCASSKSTKPENVTTDQKTSDDANDYTANKPKSGIVSIIPVPRSKRSIDQNASNDLLTSSTVVTTTVTPPSTPSTTTSGTPGRSITKIITVKPRRNDSQKLNTDEKENALSLNNNITNSHDEIKASSPVPEVTTNRRISVVMAPTKSGETETQRSVKARYVRSTRRSTQGVSSEDVEQAKKLVDKSNSNNTVSNYKPMDSVPPVDLSSSSSDKTTPTDTPGVSNKSIKTNHTSSTWNRTILENANPPSLRRFTDTDLLSSRINAENVPSDTSRSSARTDYTTSGRDTSETKLSNHFSTSTGRHVNFSGETDMNSSAYDVGNNNSSRRPTYGSRVQPVEHSPTFESKIDSTTASGGIRERRHIRERNPPERVLSSKSFSSVSDVERRLSDHNTGRSEYSPSYINTNTIQSENDVKGIIQRPTSRFLHQTLLNNTSTNSSSPVTSSTYSWNPVQIPPVYTTNMNSSSNHNNCSNADYSSLTNNTTPTPRDHVSQWQDSKDYKRLYEKEKEERERLQRELDRCNRQINQLRGEQQSVPTTASFRTSIDYGYSNSDALTNNYGSSNNNNNNSQIPDTLQNRLQSYEDKMKEIVRLREEISKMKEENGALIRVISKLSKPI